MALSGSDGASPSRNHAKPFSPMKPGTLSPLGPIATSTSRNLGRRSAILIERGARAHDGAWARKRRSAASACRCKDVKLRRTLLRPDCAQWDPGRSYRLGDRPFSVARDRPPAVSGIPRETRLGGVVPFRSAGIRQFLLLVLTHVPGQERLDIRRNLAAGRRARLEVPRQPFPGIELPQR
jgi:hypothetical protein